MLSEQKMKNLVNNRAKEYGLKPQEVYGLFGLEQLLIKISQSHYKDYFILKGGYLLSVVHGLNNRATRDLNSTIRQMPLTQKSMEQFAMFLESPEANGAIHFKVMRINAIRDRFEYEGFNLKLQFMNGRTMFPINIDLTTGEELLPVVDAQEIPLLFGEGHIEMPAYPIEQIMADKLYTTLAYGVIDDKNTRAKDLYDIHFFSKFYRDMDLEKVHHAIELAKKQRNVSIMTEHYSDVLNFLEKSAIQKKYWESFSEHNAYAAGILFEEVMASIRDFSNRILEKAK